MALDCLTDTKVWPVNSAGSLKANGSFTFSDAIRIRFKLVEKKDGSGMFISFPSRKNPNFDETRQEGDTNRRYYDEVAPLSGDVYRELLNSATTKYAEVSGGATTNGTGRGAVTRDADAPPF